MTKIPARLIQVLCFSIGAAALATNARAQIDVDSAVNHVGVGVGMNLYRPNSDRGRSSEGIAIVYRWHSFRSGWGPTFGLDWHTTDFEEPSLPGDPLLGSLRMRALLAGLGHTKRLPHRFMTSASLTGGYSFNSLSLDNGIFPAFARTGVSLVNVRVNDSPVLKPEVSLWYDVFKHVAVGVSGAYLLNRLDETVTTAAGSDVRHINADTWEVTVGVAFGVWKKPTS